MSNGGVQRSADAVSRQVAAKAFWSRWEGDTKPILADGNKGNSVLPSKLVDQLAEPDGSLVALADIESSGNAAEIDFA